MKFDSEISRPTDPHFRSNEKRRESPVPGIEIQCLESSWLRPGQGDRNARSRFVGACFRRRSTMSKHQEWKMIHLLYRVAKRQPGYDKSVLSASELIEAGVHCEPDTHDVLESEGIVIREAGAYALADPVRAVVRRFVVAKGPEADMDIRVDYPEAFVVMPFSEPWSDDVYRNMLLPGIVDAGFEARRGDEIVRIGDLSTNVWRSITQAGLVVAEVSVPNPNVYYEIGLAEALGKDVFLFKQKEAHLPADFGGSHYYAYDLEDLPSGRQLLQRELEAWADQTSRRPQGVKALEDR